MMYKLIKTETTTVWLLFLDRQMKMLQLCMSVLEGSRSRGLFPGHGRARGSSCTPGKHVCKVLMEQTHEGSLLGTAQLHVGHAPRCQRWSQRGALRVTGECRCYWGRILVFNVTMRIYHPSF